MSVERPLRWIAYLSVLCGTLPALPMLPWWVSVVLGCALLIGVAGDRNNALLLKNRTATLLGLAASALCLLQIRRDTLVESLLILLCLLLALRLATEKTPRHLLQLFLLAPILLAGSSLLSLEMAYLGYLLLLVPLVSFGMVLLGFYYRERPIRLERRQWRLLLKTAALLPLGALLLMVLFFAILPRTQVPLWSFLNAQPVANIGLNDQVRPGSVAQLAQSGRTAFRVETERLDEAQPYWRGVVLNRLEGRTWKRAPVSGKELSVPGGTPAVPLTFFAEPKADRYLVTLDRPLQVSGVRHRFAADGVITGRSHGQRKLRYQVLAAPGAAGRLGGPEEGYLQLPADLSPRLRELGRKIAAAGEDRQARISELEDFFRNQRLRYADRALPRGAAPLDAFLFADKRGSCEYFASSFAVLLRLAGVPARLVGGYLGGEYFDLGGYYLVSEDQAHVWVEALAGDGLWRRIDPSRLAINAGQALPGLRHRPPSRLRMLQDALSHYWTRLVLNYDLRQQLGLLRGAGEKIGRFEVSWLARPLILCVAASFLLALGLWWWRRQKGAPRLVRAYRHQVARCAGLEALPPSLGLFALARQSGDDLCRRFAELYGPVAYGGQALSAGDRRELRRIIRQLRHLRLSIEVEKRLPVEDNDSPSARKRTY